MINYGEIPYLFNVAIVVPLVKDSTKPNDDPNNLRPISISDAISNIFEMILLDRLNRHSPEELKQFGFKAKSSCGHAAFCINESARYFRRRGLKLYMAALDASKAFDKLNRIILWSIMLELFPKYLVYVLIKYYEKSLAIVECNGSLSTLFLTILGCKQGGVISPRLFNIYIKLCIKMVEELNLGVRIGKLVLDIILYADDTGLLCATKAGMQRMIKTVETFGLNFEIKFNAEKSLLIIFNKNIKSISRGLQIRDRIKSLRKEVRLTRSNDD